MKKKETLADTVLKRKIMLALEVRRNAAIPCKAKLIYMEIVDASIDTLWNEPGDLFTGPDFTVESISKLTNTNARAIYRNIALLVDAGLITRAYYQSQYRIFKIVEKG